VAEEQPAELAVEETQALEAPPEEEQREPTASEIAAELGWKPKDQWTGEPDAWKPAAEFIKAGRDIQQGTARELKAMREQVERLSATSATILQQELAKKDAEWRAQIAQATEEGDTATVLKLTEERPAPASTQPGPDPTVAAWVAKNPWMNTDPLAASVAREISVRLAKEGHSTADQLAAAEKEVKRRFPEHFPTPAKAPPATQTAASRNTNPGNRAKGFADMPQPAQQAALEMERLNGVKKDDYARYYWQNEAKKRVKA
jgi:hypothetical protein